MCGELECKRCKLGGGECLFSGGYSVVKWLIKWF